MRWVIPDVPQRLRQQMQQHAYLNNELLLQQEYHRAKKLSNSKELEKIYFDRLRSHSSAEQQSIRSRATNDTDHDASEQRAMQHNQPIVTTITLPTPIRRN
ncbi:hypothetical protein QR98_0032180, partial [Sarcoptes scabiei]